MNNNKYSIEYLGLQQNKKKKKKKKKGAQLQSNV